MGVAERREVFLYGAGGHARVCLEVLAGDAGWSVMGALSDDGRGVEGLGVPILGAEKFLQKATQSGRSITFCVAIGDNRSRERISRNLTESGHLLTEIVSGDAVVSPSAVIGAGAQVMPAAVVMAATRLGAGAIVNTNASVDHDCDVGAHVHIAPGAAIGGGVVVGELAMVGIGARVLPGLRVGASAVIGGGAVVIDDVPDGVTVVGNPARILPGATR
ncbi:MAG: acetyltransferase [Ilumatobacteraceae bacterium]